MKKIIYQLILILILFSLLFSFSSTYITSAFLIKDSNMKIRGEITGGTFSVEKNFFLLGFSETVPFYPNQRAICRDGQNHIHVVWLYNSTQIRYAKSTDNGQTWTINTTFYGNTSTASSTKKTPHISCNGNNITVAYEDVTADDAIIAISEDNGQTWRWYGPRTSCVQDFVVAERRGQKIYVVYQTPATSACGYGDIVFFNSSNAGSTWGSNKVILDGFYDTYLGSFYYYEPSLAVDGSGGANDKIHVATRMTTSEAGEYYYYIYYINSTNSGTSWNQEKNLIFSSINIFYNPSITFGGANVYVSYYADNKIYFNKSSDYGTTWSGERIDTIGSGTSKARYASVTVDNSGNPYVFWQQNNTIENKKWNIVYRKYTGTSWSDLVWVTNDNNDNQYVNTKIDYSGDCIEFIYRNGTSSPYNIIYASISDYGVGSSISKIAIGQPVIGIVENNSKNIKICFGLFCQAIYQIPTNLYSMNFTGRLKYSNGSSVSDAKIRFIIKDTFEYESVNKTDSFGQFYVRIDNLPEEVVTNDLNITIYVEADIEAVYKCWYNHTSQKCCPLGQLPCI